MKDRYPTWVQRGRTAWISEEQRDGTPDFYIVQDADTKRWHVKWRTSAHWNRKTYDTAKEAKAAILASLR